MFRTFDGSKKYFAVDWWLQKMFSKQQQKGKSTLAPWQPSCECRQQDRFNKELNNKEGVEIVSLAKSSISGQGAVV